MLEKMLEQYMHQWDLLQMLVKYASGLGSATPCWFVIEYHTRPQHVAFTYTEAESNDQFW
jgi:hypothetical protein